MRARRPGNLVSRLLITSPTVAPEDCTSSCPWVKVRSDAGIRTVAMSVSPLLENGSSLKMRRRRARTTHLAAGAPREHARTKLGGLEIISDVSPADGSPA